MFKKIIITTGYLVLMISMAQSQSNLGLKLGFGMLDDDGDNRFRILLGGDAALNMLNQDPLLFQLGLDGELSYQWYNVENEDVSSYGFRMLLDFVPEAVLNLGGIIKPSLGAGLTFGAEGGKYSYSYSTSYGSYDYESTSSGVMYGLNLQPGLTLELDNLFAKTRMKYRYLFQNVHWESESSSWGSDSDDYELNSQSLTFILSAGIKSGNTILEGGIQAENWVYKDRDSETWSDWPENWEFLLFLRLAKPL